MSIPNLITTLRLVFSAVSTYFGYNLNFIYFALFYVLSLLTDFFDGFFARKLKLESKTGAIYDVIADDFMLLCALFSAYFFNKETLYRYANHIIFILFLFVFLQASSLSFKKELVFMRTYLSLIAAVIFPFFIFSIMLFEVKILIYFYFISMVCSLAEKFFLKMSGIRKKSIFHGKNRRIKALFLAVCALLLIILFALPQKTFDNKVCFEDKFCVIVEIKGTPEERALGLMFRESLAENEGMLFVFESPNTYSFWMKNMKIPIDIIFLDSEKKIVHIAKGISPCTENPCELYAPSSPSLYVVETASGFSDKHMLKIGQKVDFSFVLRK